MEITKINHVYFVMSIQLGLNPEDIQAFEKFADLFVGMEKKMSIILSFSQTLSTKEQYDHFTKQFDEVNELKPIRDKIDGRIFFLGAAQKNPLYDIEKLTQNVHQQRAILFEHIIQQKETFNVKQLKVYRDNLGLIENVRELLSQCCKSMETCIDLPKFDAFISHYRPTDQGSHENEDEKDGRKEDEKENETEDEKENGQDIVKETKQDL